MSEWLFKKLNLCFSLLAIVILFVTIFSVAKIEVKDLDLWLHLSMGKYIFNTFSIPKIDILSGTIAGTPWINHEWLFQVIMYLIYSQSGIEGLVFFQVLLSVLIFVILLRLGYQEDRQLIPVFSLVFVLMVFQHRLTHRPDLFSVLFFVLYFYFLASKLHRKISVMILFLLQVLWNNIHGFFILGPLIILLGVLGEWGKRHLPLPYQWNVIGRLEEEEYRRLKNIFVVVLLACFLNPHFIEGALYPFNIFLSISGDSKVFFKHISELTKPITWDTLLVTSQYLYYKILILISALSFLLNRKKVDIGLLLFWIFFLVFSLGAIRNIVFFAIAAFFVIIANFQDFEMDKKIKSFLKSPKMLLSISMGAKIGLIFLMLNVLNTISLRGYFDFDQFQRKEEYQGGVSLRNFPYKAASFLVDNKIQGKFFNDFNSGAYLIGRCFPHIRVFIDGRTEVYGAEYFKKYKSAFDGNVEILEDVIKEYNLTGAFLGAVYVPVREKTIRYFYENKDWALVYFDYDATIFLKRTEANAEVIKKYNVDLSKWKVEKMDFLKLGVERVTPYRYVNRANALFHLGFYDQAKKEALEAIRISPYYLEPFRIIAKVSLKEKNYKEALDHLRNVKLLGGDDRFLFLNLARCFFELKAYDMARKQCEKVLALNNQEAKAFFLLALINIKDGDAGEGFRLFKKANDLSPRSYSYLKEIADSFFDHKEYYKAKEVYRLAAEGGNDKQALSQRIEASLKFLREDAPLNNVEGK